MLAETYTGLVTDQAHIFFELTWEVITGAVVYLAGRWFLPRFKDRFHKEIDTSHGIEHADDGKPHNIDELLSAINTLASAYAEAVGVVQTQNVAIEEYKRDFDRVSKLLQEELRKNQ